MAFNLLIIALSAFIPLVVGFIWYHPNVLGKAWMQANKFTQKDVESGNMPLILVLTYFMSFLMGTVITFLVIHQNHLFSVFADVPAASEQGTTLNLYISEFMSNYGNKFRTFGHGAFHGLFTVVFFVLPMITINALFERRGAKYIFIHVGYWLISISLMGGVLCQFS